MSGTEANNSSMPESCPLPDRSEDGRVRSLLERSPAIAVVGMSLRPGRPSRDAGRYLHDQGFPIFPIHPTADTIEGLRAYPALSALPASANVEIVVVFVSAGRAGPVADEAARIGAGTIWFQPGAANPEAADRARQLGLEVVTGRCMMADHRRLVGPSISH